MPDVLFLAKPASILVTEGSIGGPSAPTRRLAVDTVCLEDVARFEGLDSRFRSMIGRILELDEEFGLGAGRSLASRGVCILPGAS